MADLPKKNRPARTGQPLVEAETSDLADDFTDDDEIEDDVDPFDTLQYAGELFPEDWMEEDEA